MRELELRSNPAMDLKDIWRAHLIALVDMEAPGEGHGVKTPGYWAVANKARVNKEYVYQVYSGRKQPGEDFAKAIGRAYANGRDPAWINYPPPEDGSGFSLAHPVSHDSVTIGHRSQAIVVIGWGDMESKDLPSVFRVEAPDDAMADRVRKGWIVEFDRTLEARQDDGVLVEDREGRWYFRLYSQGPQNKFQALALSRSYQPLDSERDGLTVLAVLVGVPTRWS